MQTRSLTLSGLLFFGLALAAATPALADEPYPISPELRSVLSQPRYFQSESPVESYERSRRRWKKAWIASWVAFAAVNVLDAHSSSGKGEANPFLRGSDGRFAPGKALAVKGALGAGFFFWQQRTIRKNPQQNFYKTFTFATAGAAGALGAVAAHNYSLK